MWSYIFFIIRLKQNVEVILSMRYLIIALKYRSNNFKEARKGSTIR